MFLPDNIIYGQNVGHTTINDKISWKEACITSIYELNDPFSYQVLFSSYYDL